MTNTGSGRGAELVQTPGKLFAELIRFFVLKLVHAPYAGFEDRPFGKSDVWMNAINVEPNLGTTERALFAAFYSPIFCGLDDRLQLSKTDLDIHDFGEVASHHTV